jgi:hypothetical protein
MLPLMLFVGSVAALRPLDRCVTATVTATQTSASFGAACGRRAAAATLAAALGAPIGASALDVKRAVKSLESDATISRTAADFTSVIEVRPVSGPAGAGAALVVVDAGNAGDFEFMWLKDAVTGEVISTAYYKLPPPMLIKTSVARGRLVTPMAYSSRMGLYEGDTFEVDVGRFRPEAMYPGRPDGPVMVGGRALYAPR